VHVVARVNPRTHGGLRRALVMRFGNIRGRSVLREVVLAWLAMTGVLLIILRANEAWG